jgi:hypothetical protein
MTMRDKPMKVGSLVEYTGIAKGKPLDYGSDENDVQKGDRGLVLDLVGSVGLPRLGYEHTEYAQVYWFRGFTEWAYTDRLTVLS